MSIISIHCSIHPTFHGSVCPSISLSICQTAFFPPIYLSVHPSICLSVFPSNHPSVFQSFPAFPSTLLPIRVSLQVRIDRPTESVTPWIHGALALLQGFPSPLRSRTALLPIHQLRHTRSSVSVSQSAHLVRQRQPMLVSLFDARRIGIDRVFAISPK